MQRDRGFHLGGDITLEELADDVTVSEDATVTNTGLSSATVPTSSSPSPSSPTAMESTTSPSSLPSDKASSPVSVVPPTLAPAEIQVTTDTPTPTSPEFTPLDDSSPPSLPIITQDDDDTTVASTSSITEDEWLAEDINNQLSTDPTDIDLLDIVAVLDYVPTRHGVRMFEVEYADGATAYHPFSTLKKDCPKVVADFILANSDKMDNVSLTRCARLFLRNLRWTLRRITSYYGL